MRSRMTPSLGLVLLLISGAAPAQTQKTRLTIPATYSQGGATAALGLETTAWWTAFGDPTLDSLMARAVQGSLTVEQAKARILQARASVSSAKADRWPSVDASASVKRSQTSANAQGSGSSAAATLYQAGFDASWEWDLFGGKKKIQEAAQARYEASLEDLRGTILTLEGDVATNYIALRGNQALLEITRKNAETQQETVKVTEERYKLGLTSYLDVAQAKAQLASTNSEIPTLEAAARQSCHRISLLLGQEPTALVKELSADKPLPSAQSAIATGLPSELLSRRPDLRGAERNLAAAMADVGVAKADLYPKFDLTFGLGLQSLQASDFASVSSRYWSIVPGLSLPIFNRGNLKANVAKKEAVYQENLAAFRASYQTALEDVENALTSYYAEQSRRHDLEESLRQSQEALGLAQERYRRGLTSFLDVLTAQTTLHASQSSLSVSEANLLKDLVSLHKALGGGWSADQAAPPAS